MNQTLNSLTHDEWCAFINSIICKYQHVCYTDPLIEHSDLEQEAWRALLTAAQNYRIDKAKGKFTSYAWIYINHLVRHFAYSKYQKSQMFINDNEIDIEDPYDDFEIINTNEIFRKAIDVLSNEEMELIDQRFVQSMTYEEIAKISNISSQAIQVRFNKIIEKLNRKMRLENVIFD